MKGKNLPFWSQWICYLLLLFLLLYCIIVFQMVGSSEQPFYFIRQVLSTFRITNKSQRTCKWIYFNFEFGLKSTGCKMWLSQEEQNRTEVTSEFYFLPGYCHYLTFLVAPWKTSKIVFILPNPEVILYNTRLSVGAYPKSMCSEFLNFV